MPFISVTVFERYFPTYGISFSALRHTASTSSELGIPDSILKKKKEMKKETNIKKETKSKKKKKR